ncbi:MAG: hypothetical protein IPM54_35105 [Polyangiaceae bacterium]|nr:hypothetical protein [Polyangiaceae bacterium]
MTRRRSAMLGVLLLGFGGGWMTGACDAGTQLPPRVTLPDTSTETPEECPDDIEDPCMRWYIPLLGNPKDDLALRAKYIAAFGSPCYMSVNDTFNCFYQEKELKTKACNDANRSPSYLELRRTTRVTNVNRSPALTTSGSRWVRMSRTRSSSGSRMRRDKHRSSWSMASRRR